jgi:hypothetical protein
MSRASLRRSWVAVWLAASACGGDVISEPGGKSGGVGGGAASATSATSAGVGASGSSGTTTATSGGGGLDVTSSSIASSSSGSEVHTMCFMWDPSMPCPTPEEAPGHLCTPCPGKGCSFIGEVLGRGVFQNGSCCYPVDGNCVPNP